MKLAVSNLAWPIKQDGEALSLLANLGVSGVEVAPTRIADWEAQKPSTFALYDASLRGEGLRASSLQAIFYGRPDVQLLGTEVEFDKMREHLKKVGDIASSLGAGVMVFGAPHNRHPGSLPTEQAWDLARERLSILGDIAEDSEAVLGLEPVPSAYGGDFLTSWRDVLRIVEEVSHSAIRVHLDTACVALGGDDIEAAVSGCASWITHFHAAQFRLTSFDEPLPGHSAAARALSSIGYQKWIAIEMLEQAPNPLLALSAAVTYVSDTYSSQACKKSGTEAANANKPQ